MFTVQWDDTRRRYTALDETDNLLGLSQDLNNAVGLAVREAQLASKEGSKVTVKVQQGNGALKTEYVAQPLRSQISNR